jgi:hypothetical protein
MTLLNFKQIEKSLGTCFVLVTGISKQLIILFLGMIIFS